MPHKYMQAVEMPVEITSSTTTRLPTLRRVVASQLHVHLLLVDLCLRVRLLFKHAAAEVQHNTTLLRSCSPNETTVSVNTTD